MADIEEASLLAHCAMFFHDAAILHWHFPAAKLYEARTQGNVLLIEWGTFQRGRCGVMCCHGCSLHCRLEGYGVCFTISDFGSDDNDGSVKKWFLACFVYLL